MQIGVSMRKLFVAVLCVAVWGVSFAEGPTKDVPWRVIGKNEYANFVSSWDERQVPVRCALIQTPEHYDAYFAPAAVKGYKVRYAPEMALYDTDNILVVARVVTAPLEKTVFKAERVIDKNSALEFHYRFFDPDSKASFKMKESLSVRIPKGAYRRVRFIENGETVCEQAVAPIVDPGMPFNR